MHLQERMHALVTGAGVRRRETTVALGVSAKGVLTFYCNGQKHPILIRVTVKTVIAFTCNSTSRDETDDVENIGT